MTQLASLQLYSVVGLLASTLIYFWIGVKRNPVSAVPGPWYAKWTSWVVTYHYLRGQRIYYVESLHQKYGPIVQVGPNEVAITDTDALKAVYAVKETFVKSSWYTKFTTSTNHHIFNTDDIQYHRKLRRLLSNPISDSSLVKNHLPLVTQLVDLAIQRMREESQARGVADVFKWWFFLTTDTIGDLTFGESFKMLERGKKNEYIIDFQNADALAAVRSTFPWLLPLLKKIPIPAFQKAGESVMRLRGYAEDSLKRYNRRVQSDPAGTHLTLFTKLFRAADEETLTFSEIHNNSVFYLLAGTDTTANTLSFLVWSVCRRPDVKAKLVAELKTLPQDWEEADLRGLKYLGYVIDETMRLFPAVASAMPRVVPPDGAKLSGYWLPAGTIVAAHTHSVHRRPAVFTNPESFEPERWEQPTRAMKDAFMPFSRGSRVCLGIHLANLQLRLGAAKFFLEFPDAKVSNLEGMRDGDMVPPKTYLLSCPPGKRCLIQVQ